MHLFRKPSRDGTPPRGVPKRPYTHTQDRKPTFTQKAEQSSPATP